MQRELPALLPCNGAVGSEGGEGLGGDVCGRNDNSNEEPDKKEETFRESAVCEASSSV